MRHIIKRSFVATTARLSSVASTSPSGTGMRSPRVGPRCVLTISNKPADISARTHLALAGSRRGDGIGLGKSPAFTKVIAFG